MLNTSNNTQKRKPKKGIILYHNLSIKIYHNQISNYLQLKLRQVYNSLQQWWLFSCSVAWWYVQWVPEFVDRPARDSWLHFGGNRGKLRQGDSRHNCEWTHCVAVCWVKKIQWRDYKQIGPDCNNKNLSYSVFIAAPNEMHLAYVPFQYGN